MSLFSFTLALPLSTTSPSLNQVIQSVSTPLAFFFSSSFFILLLSPQTKDGHLAYLFHLSYLTRWQSLKATKELEGNDRA